MLPVTTLIGLLTMNAPMAAPPMMMNSDHWHQHADLAVVHGVPEQNASEDDD